MLYALARPCKTSLNWRLYIKGRQLPQIMIPICISFSSKFSRSSPIWNCFAWIGDILSTQNRQVIFLYCLICHPLIVCNNTCPCKASQIWGHDAIRMSPPQIIMLIRYSFPRSSLIWGSYCMGRWYNVNSCLDRCYSYIDIQCLTDLGSYIYYHRNQ